MSNNKKIIDIYKSRNNLLEILTMRGYDTSNYDGFSLNQIHTLVNNQQLDMLFENDTNKIYVKYFIEKMLRPNNIYDIIEDLINIEQILSANDEIIIIIKDEPNDSIHKLQKVIYSHDNIFINIININRLQYNILKHVMVPKHRILSEEEKKEIIKKYNIENDNIPNISRFDPVAQIIGLRPNQYCEIERPSKTSITSLFYRICSN
jgi:DNA-directed RNA polymerase I, II, and III subunit RPABC1